MTTPPAIVPSACDDDLSLDALLPQIATLARRCAADIVDREDVDDLAQDVVLECLVKIRNFYWTPEPDELPRVVRTMVRARAVDMFRRQQASTVRDTDFHAHLSGSTREWMQPELLLEERELAAIQEEALSTVSETCRRAYVLVRGEDMSYEAAARELGVTTRAVGNHVARAKRRVMRCLAKKGVVSPSRVRRGGGCGASSLGDGVSATGVG